MNKYDILRLVLNFFELLACVTGLIYRKKIWNSYWKWFWVYLLAIVLMELFCQYLAIVANQENQWIYVQLIVPGEFLFFFWLFYKYFQDYKVKIIPLIGACIYMLCFAFDRIYMSKLQFSFFSFSYMVGSIILLVLILFFLVRFVRSDDLLHYKKNMMFWVSTGLLVFFLGSLPFYGLWNTLAKKHPDIFNLYWIVQISFDYIMYLFFAFAFIWGKPK
jgi:hypothetical protein